MNKGIMGKNLRIRAVVVGKSLNIIRVKAFIVWMNRMQFLLLLVP
jgi:hypothetical protein